MCKKKGEIPSIACRTFRSFDTEESQEPQHYTVRTVAQF